MKADSIVRSVLPNGLRVVYNKTRKNRVVINVGVKVGLLDESEETNGVSHFLEHMLWEGESTKASKEIRDKVNEMRGEYNAYTSLELTHYYIEVPRKYFNEALELIAKVVSRIDLNEEDIEKEKKVILNELTLYADHPFYSVDALARKSVFEGNMYANEVGGNEENVKRMNKQLLEEHYAKYYASNNMVVAVTGNVEDPIKKIEELFRMQPKFITEHKKYEPKAVLPKQIYKKGDTKASYVELAFLTTKFNTVESKALDLIEEILEDGKDFSLLDEVRFKHGLTYTVNVYSHSLVETGIFGIGLSTEQKQTTNALELIRNQLNKLQNVNQKELEAAKKRYLEAFKEILKEPQIKAQILAVAELTDDWEDYYEHKNRIRAVTLEEVKNTAKQFFANNYAEIVLEQKEVA